LAAQILATGDETLAGALEAMRRDMEAAVLAKDAALNV
jgi:phosphoribosylcarboxyaminoimidazole (NCAIR) mutase